MKDKEETLRETVKIDATTGKAKPPKSPKMGTIVFPDRPVVPVSVPEPPPVSVIRSAGGRRSLVIITGKLRDVLSSLVLCVTYAMLCHTVLDYTMLCYTMLCYVMLCCLVT